MCLLKVEEAEISRMSFTGHVVDGQVVLDGPMPLPNGTPVRIEPIAHGESKNGTPSRAAAHASTSMEEVLQSYGRSAGRCRPSTRSLSLRLAEKMTIVFADTAFYVAAVNPRDEWHSVAIGIASEYTGQCRDNRVCSRRSGKLLQQGTQAGCICRFAVRLARKCGCRDRPGLYRTFRSAPQSFLLNVRTKTGHSPIVPRLS